MLEKYILLEKIDEAIENKATSPENKELFIEVKAELLELRAELINANSKDQYIEIAVKLANIINAFAKFFENSG